METIAIAALEPIRYRDFYFRLLACLFAAHILVMHGEDFSTWTALTMWSYYPTLAINYAIALILAYVVRKITMRLDEKHPWERDNSFWPRLLLQFGLGVGAVSVLSFLLVLIYFLSFSQDIMASTYPKFEFPFSVALLTLLNAYYTLYYFYSRYRQALAEREGAIPFQSAFRHHVMVLSGSERVSLAVEEVASISFYERSVLVRTFDGRDLLADQTLDSFEQELDTHMFFRINRALIAHRSACRSYEPLEHGKLRVHVEPDPVVETTVSQRKAADFKEWMKG